MFWLNSNLIIFPSLYTVYSLVHEMLDNLQIKTYKIVLCGFMIIHGIEGIVS